MAIGMHKDNSVPPEGLICKNPNCFAELYYWEEICPDCGRPKEAVDPDEKYNSDKNDK